MGLKSCNFPSTLDTSHGNLISDFFLPALKASVRYDRAVGFFSASWLRLASKGMVQFAGNSGRARWVTSPILSPEDWQALQVGEAARYEEIIRRSVQCSLDELERKLEADTHSALAMAHR